ncbi:MAG: hypothetical protein KBB32_03800 [Spirochaetia bacterium]|nr:hypothetical protein [Spirochaetia bacterium]
MRKLSLAFMNVPLAGHLAAMEPIMRACAGAGHTVTLYGYDSMAELAARVGAGFRPYAVQESVFDPGELGSVGTLFRLLMRFARDNVDELADSLRAEPPDCLIHDQFCPWGKYAAHAAGVRAASSVTSMIFERDAGTGAQSMLRGLSGMEEGNDIRAALSERLGLPKWGIIDAIQNKQGLNLLMRLPELQRGHFDSYMYIGPCLPERDSVSAPDKRTSEPMAYMSMGTVYAYDGDEAERAITSLRKAGFRVLVAAGPLFERLCPLSDPPGLEVIRRCDQLSALALASVFLTHGGMNGTQEALYRGTVPIFRPLQDEQASIADAVCSRGAGLRWDGRSDLGAMALESLADPSIQAGVDALGAKLRERGGVSRAVEALEHYAGGRL